MKQNPDFIMIDAKKDHVLVPVGKAAANFSTIINLNEMGQIIWNMLETETTTEEVLKKILEEYDVSEERARSDIDSFISNLRKYGCIED